MVLKEIPDRPGFFRLEPVGNTATAAHTPQKRPDKDAALPAEPQPKKTPLIKNRLAEAFKIVAQGPLLTGTIALIVFAGLRLPLSNGNNPAKSAKGNELVQADAVPEYYIHEWGSVWQRQETALRDPQKAAFYNEWLEQFAAYKNASLMDKAKIVDQVVDNLITYQFDDVTYGQREYWASPYETVMNRHGDCDDYAVLKYDILVNYLGTNGHDCYAASVDTRGGTSSNHLLVLLNFGTHDNGQFYILNNDIHVDSAGNRVQSPGTVAPVNGATNYLYGFSPKGPTLFSTKR